MTVRARQALLVFIETTACIADSHTYECCDQVGTHTPVILSRSHRKIMFQGHMRGGQELCAVPGVW